MDDQKWIMDITHTVRIVLPKYKYRETLVSLIIRIFDKNSTWVYFMFEIVMNFPPIDADLKPSKNGMGFLLTSTIVSIWSTSLGVVGAQYISTVA